MRITPLDVTETGVPPRSVRGFDCDEVRAFLTTLADEYEAVLVDNKQIRERRSWPRKTRSPNTRPWSGPCGTP